MAGGRCTVLQQALDRFGKNLLPLFLAGLIGSAVTLLPMMVVAGVTGFTAFAGRARMGADPMAMMAVMGSMLGALALMMLVALLLYPLGMAGQVAAVRQVLAGAAPEPGRFFTDALTYYGRLLAYLVLVGVTWLAIALINLLPILGTIIFLLAGLVLGPAFLFFGPYALVAENLSATGAYAMAWRAITRRFGATLVAGLVLVGIGIVFALINAIVGMLPLVGWLVSLALTAAFTPFLILYMAMRFLAEVRPHLGESVQP